MSKTVNISNNDKKIYFGLFMNYRKRITTTIENICYIPNTQFYIHEKAKHGIRWKQIFFNTYYSVASRILPCERIRSEDITKIVEALKRL